MIESKGFLSEYFDGNSSPSIRVSDPTLNFLTIDKQGNIFTESSATTQSGNASETVAVYPAGSETASSTYPVPYAYPIPEPMAIDSQGQLYVIVDRGAATYEMSPSVETFAPGSQSATLSSGSSDVNLFGGGFAIDAANLTYFSGEIYFPDNTGQTTGIVTNSCISTGTSKPPGAIAVDRYRAIFAAMPPSGYVQEFPYCTNVPTSTITDLQYPAALAIDPSGQLYAATANGVSVYAAGRTTASSRIVVNGGVSSLSVVPSSSFSL